MTQRSDANTTLNCRVLLVEDTLDDQRLILRVLSNAGADVTLECNGEAAVDCVLKLAETSQRFDIILMDMVMPTLDGIAATRQLRKSGIKEPIIAVSGLDSSDVRTMWTAAGCNEYVTKPFKPQELIECVARFQPNKSFLPT